MKRTRSQSALRGSVRQNSVRMRAHEASHFGFLMRLGSLVGLLALVVGIGIWLWTIHWPQKQATHVAGWALQLSQKADFSVKDIVVEGRQQTSKESLALALGVMPDEAIFGIDTKAAQTRISRLPWTASVVVERRLPDTIFVHLTERLPMARWQHENHTMVIDTEGKELSDAKLDQFNSLPLVVGAGAPEQTAELIKDLKEFPMINDKVMAAVWVSERRWDLHIQPKVVVRLPAKGLAAALKQLAVLITQQNILDRDIVAIDLRMPERMAIEPSTSTHSTGNIRL